MKRETAWRRPGRVIALVAGALLVVAAVAWVTLFAIHRTPGKAIASRDVVPGEAFELDAVATGEPLRVWMDIECDFCANAVATGQLEVIAAGAVVASHRFDEGGSYLFSGEGGRMGLHGDLLFAIPALDDGTAMTVKGTIVVHPAKAVGVWPPSEAGKQAPLPLRLYALRVWVAP
jgi:hypothetical protein